MLHGTCALSSIQVRPVNKGHHLVVLAVLTLALSLILMVCNGLVLSARATTLQLTPCWQCCWTASPSPHTDPLLMSHMCSECTCSKALQAEGPACACCKFVQLKLHMAATSCKCACMDSTCDSKACRKQASHWRATPHMIR